ncbi:hypothetical protein HZA56_14050 [Candidatus Poribacteria bacterium]|nr:hypothetical protein [Candidatus Poribacteria bacterium]
MILVRRIAKQVGDAFILILKRLPMIAIYTLAAFTILTIGSNLVSRYQVSQDKRFYTTTPATHFINYTSFIAQPGREGEDVIYTVCRNHDANYRVDGARTLYIVPEGKTEDARVFVYVKDIKNGVIDAGNCASYFIRDREYHFKPGNYQITLNLCFSVKYDIRKCVNVKSNVFKIREPVGGSPDTQVQINNLQQQLQDLQQILNNLQPPVTQSSNGTPTSAPRSQSATTSPPSVANGTTSPSSSQPATQPSQPQQSQPQPSLIERTLDGIFAPIRGIL